MALAWKFGYWSNWKFASSQIFSLRLIGYNQDLKKIISFPYKNHDEWLYAGLSLSGNPRPTMYWYALSQSDSQLFKDGRLKIDAEYLSSAQEILSDEKFMVEQKVSE